MILRPRAVALATVLLVVLPVASACTGGTPGDGPPATPSATPSPDGTVAPATPPATPSPAPPAPQPPAPQPPAPPPPAPPPPTIPSHLLGVDIEVIPTDRRVVALTFDAGANADAVPTIIKVLAAEDITATFYLTGAFAQKFPAASRSITAAGHRIGNHSTTHPAFTSLTADQIHDEIRATERLLRGDFGADPRPWFRFPYGDRDARTIAAVNGLGYVPVRWTVDTLGWQGTSGGRTAAEVTARVLDTARPGQVVLMHVGSHPQDGSMLDAQALPGVIDGLRAKGYGFVTLDALLARS